MKLAITTKYFIAICTAFFMSISCKPKASSEKGTKPIASSNINLHVEGKVRLFNGESIENWEITNFGTQGHVYVSSGQINLGMGDGCTGVNWTSDFPKNNYQIELEAMRVSGNDFFCGLTFPVNSEYCSFIVGGWAGVVVGLSTIDDKDGAENETTSMRSFNLNEWYKIRLKVSETKIEAWINSEQVVDFIYTDRKIGIRPEVGLSRPFGISTWKTTGAIRNIYLKELK